MLARLARSSAVVLPLLVAAPARGLDEASLGTPEVAARLDAVMARAETGTFAGVKDAAVAYGIFRLPDGAPRAHVVLVPGLTESYAKYGETILDLNAAGYDVVAMDLRGMGRSARLAPDPQVVHVDAFDDYVADLSRLFDDVVRRRVADDRLPVYGLAHSTGGLVVLQAVAFRPGMFQRVALSCPLLAMETGWIPRWVAYAIARFNVWRGAGQDYLPGTGPFDAATATFEANRTTHSAARFARQRAQWLAEPATLMSGPSNGWLATALDASWRAQRRAPSVRTPLVVFTAGEDAFTDPAGVASFCEATASYCERVDLPTARHEVLFETDAVRDVVMAKILAFFDGSVP
jgi:lysophospholipase